MPNFALISILRGEINPNIEEQEKFDEVALLPAINFDEHDLKKFSHIYRTFVSGP